MRLKAEGEIGQDFILPLNGTKPCNQKLQSALNIVMNNEFAAEDRPTTISTVSNLDAAAQKTCVEQPENEIFTEADKDRLIEMAWEDRTPFEAIAYQFGLMEKEVIAFMRSHSKPSSFRMWRQRTSSRKTKHQFLREKSVNRFKCTRQKISGNKISKR